MELPISIIRISIELMNNSMNLKHPDNMCPFLGLSADERTAMSYPSTQNYCHHVTPAASPSSAHQRKFCLVEDHTQCPIFLAQKKTSMPAEFRTGKSAKKQAPDHRRTRVWILLALVVIASLVLLWLAYNQQLAAAGVMPPAPESTHTTRAETLAPTSTATAQPTGTFTSVPPTQTVTALPLHLIETPVGVERRFLIHRVIEGESLISLADTYFTTPEAIRAVNYGWTDSLWANAVLIIPIDQVDVSGVAPMTAYAVDASGITVEALALDQNVDAAELRTLNALPEGYIFQPGEWVLIPHAAKK